PRADSNRVEYRRGSLTEWYVNGPAGLEQGFTINEPPGRSHGQPLTVLLAHSGDWTATVDASRTGLNLSERNGKVELRYTELTAYDDGGQRLPAWLEARGEQLLLHVKDRGARYPVVIDPVFQVAELTASDEQPLDHFGVTVSISGDTVVVGAPGATVGSNSQQ